MKQDDTRLLVLRHFEEWATAKGKNIPYTEPDGGLTFFAWLRANHPEALQFQASGDKWQRVHIWIRNAGFVTR